jgi:signal transduction histidine kinase
MSLARRARARGVEAGERLGPRGGARADPAAPLRRALLALGIAGAAAAAGALGLILTSDRRQEPLPLSIMDVAIGVSFVATGLLAWWRRPENRIGAIMAATGFAFFAGSLITANSAGPYTAGLLVGHLNIPLAFALLAYPTGRLERRNERIVVAAAAVWASILNLVVVMLDAPGPGSRAPENLVLVSHDHDLGEVVSAVHQGILAVIAAALVVSLVVRWRSSTRLERQELLPVCLAGGFAVTFLIARVVADGLGISDAGQEALEILTLVAVAGLPFGFLFGLVRARMTGGAALGSLVQRLAAVPPPGGLRALLAEALGDPSLDLAYWAPSAAGYVDAEGRPVTPPPEGGRRVWTPVERDGRPVGAIVHQAAVARETDLARAAGSAAALAMENERLEAELRARVADLRTSRARIIAAGDAERRRLERDLHDGAQQRLVSLALRLRLVRGQVERDPAAAGPALDEAMDELGEALAELRELARGIHPAVLTDRGLPAALRSLAGRATLPVEILGTPEDRLPPPVEAAAYFVVAEALTNVARYAEATHATVLVARGDGRAVVEVRDDGRGGADPERGSGLRGLADRVGALEGRLAVESPAGAGTLVRAEIPCGS